MLLDLSSAFDTVDHATLLSVLRTRFGVDGAALTWFESNLSDRFQTFQVSGAMSVPVAVDCSVPQGSVLGPVKFISYTEDVISVFKKHGVRHHLYADDKQFYVDVPISNIATTLQDCVSDVSGWCSSRRLQLNSEKTELIWFGTRQSLQKVNDDNLALQLESGCIEPVSVVRDLGVLLDSELTMKHHVSKVASTCFYQLRRLRQLRRLVGKHVTAQLVSALILSRLDYCNALLAGLPCSTIQHLQRFENAAARLVCDLRPHDHVTPALKQLHWLPIKSRIAYKCNGQVGM